MKCGEQKYGFDKCTVCDAKVGRFHHIDKRVNVYFEMSDAHKLKGFVSKSIFSERLCMMCFNLLISNKGLDELVKRRLEKQNGKS